MNLVIALDQNALWYDCDSHYNSSSYIPVSCDDSTYCPGQTSGCFNCHGAPHKPGCTDNTCGYYAANPFSTVTWVRIFCTCLRLRFHGDSSPP
ncbi:hypothetical protein S83_011143 [Arachis hypogaea]